MANDIGKKIILVGYFATPDQSADDLDDHGLIHNWLLVDQERDVKVERLGEVKDGKLPVVNPSMRQGVEVIHLNGKLFQSEEVLGGSDKQKRQELILKIAQQIAAFPQLQLVVLPSAPHEDFVQQLLLLGVPMVLALPAGAKAENQLGDFYLKLAQGLTLRQASDQIGVSGGIDYTPQEVKYNPETESLEWDEKQFPDGPKWDGGILFRANKWRSLSWRVRLPLAIPIQSTRGKILGQLKTMAGQGEKVARPFDDPSKANPNTPNVRGNSRAVRRGAAKTREMHQQMGRASNTKKRRRNWLIGVLVAIGVAGIATPLIVMLRNQEAEADAFGLMPCPFPESSNQYRVVAFPFQIVENCGPAANRFTDAVKVELKRLRDRGLSIDPRYQELENCPSTFQDVMSTAEVCNTDLFIWGQYLRDSTTKREYLRVYFVTENQAREDEFIELADLHSRIEGFGITQADSILSHDVQQLIAWGMGIRHLQLEEYDQAIDALTMIKPKQDRLRSLVAQELTLAYSQAGLYDQARSYFDELIALNPDEPGYYFERARMLTLMDQPEEALADYEEVLRMQPENLEALTNKGLILSQLGRFFEAKDDLNAAITANPQRADLLARRAQIYMAEENYEAALADLDQSLENDPEQAGIFFERGKLLQQLGREEEAIADVQQALLLKPDLVEANLFRGDVLAQAEKWEEALTAYNHVLEDRVTAEALTRRGAVYENLEQYEPAANDFGQATKLKPTLTEAWMGLARANGKMGAEEDAMEALGRVLSQQPGNLPALTQRSTVYLEQEKWIQAQHDLDEILSQDPENQKGIYGKAVVLLETGDADAADRMARKLVEDAGPELALLKGRIALGRGEFAEAERQLNRAQQLAPEDPQIFLYKGVTQLKQDRLDDARQSLQRSLDLGGRPADVYLYFGDIQWRKSNLNGALSDYSRAISEDPERGAGYLRRALLYQQIQLYDSALQDYDRAIALDPQNAVEAYLQRGKVKVELNEYNEALFDLNQAISLAPGDIRAYCERGRLYQLIGNFRQAEEDIEQAEAIVPGSPWPPYYLAIIYEDLGRQDEAFVQVELALSRDRDEAAIYNLRGELFADSGDYQKAMRDFSRALNLNPRYADAHNNQGDLARKGGDYDQAINHYDATIAINPNHDRALYHRGFVHFLEGREDQAIKDIKRSLEIRPGQGIRYATLAQIYAKRQEDEPFFYYLNLALENGYPSTELKRDPAFSEYLNHPDFERLIP